MTVEPMANDNVNLIGRICYAVSNVICVPNPVTDKGSSLGVQAGENKRRQLALKGGMNKFKRAV
jgi:hypothetical protein